MTIKPRLSAFTATSVRCAVSLAMLVWVSLLAVCYVRFLTVQTPTSPESCARNDTDYVDSTERNLIERLAQTIRFRTISYSRNRVNTSEVARFREFIETSFPTLHSSPLVVRELVNGHSLLFWVKGSDPSLKPYLLTAHMDVVPVKEEEWDVHPFEGRVVNGSLYGRGTLDCKNAVMGMLEAMEFALEKGFKPQRTVYLAFGHDEEVSGFNGAAQIASLLESRDVQLEFLLDEGLFVVHGMLPGIREPAALVGVAEKGYLTVNLSVTTEGGHSSAAPVETAVVILSKALSKLEGSVHGSQFGKGTELDILVEAAPYANGLFRFIYSNIWLFSPIIAWVFNQNPATSANIRTTTAVTMVGGGIKENVIPTFAWAIVNHRIFPTQSVQEVIELDHDVIRDARVKVDIVTAHEPVPISPYGNHVFGWKALKKSVGQIYPKSPVLPALMVARTDSSWYTNLTTNIYRFTPVSLLKGDINRFHGANERIGIDNYEQVVNFYYHLIKNADSAECPQTTTSHPEL